jgi:hypothetical protein
MAEVGLSEFYEKTNSLLELAVLGTINALLFDEAFSFENILLTSSIFK